MRKCNGCEGLSPLSETSCLHCGETIAVRRSTGAVVALVAAASVTVTACLNPVAVYGGPPCDPQPDGGLPSYCVDDTTDAGTDGGP